jgi:hypothetical protein
VYVLLKTRFIFGYFDDFVRRRMPLTINDLFKFIIQYG